MDIRSTTPAGCARKSKAILARRSTPSNESLGSAADITGKKDQRQPSRARGGVSGRGLASSVAARTPKSPAVLAMYLRNRWYFRRARPSCVTRRAVDYLALVPSADGRDTSHTPWWLKLFCLLRVLIKELGSPPRMRCGACQRKKEEGAVMPSAPSRGGKLKIIFWPGRPRACLLRPPWLFSLFSCPGPRILPHCSLAKPVAAEKNLVMLIKLSLP